MPAARLPAFLNAGSRLEWAPDGRSATAIPPIVSRPSSTPNVLFAMVVRCLLDRASRGSRHGRRMPLQWRLQPILASNFTRFRQRGPDSTARGHSYSEFPKRDRYLIVLFIHSNAIEWRFTAYICDLANLALSPLPQTPTKSFLPQGAEMSGKSHIPFPDSTPSRIWPEARRRAAPTSLYAKASGGSQCSLPAWCRTP